MKDKKNQQKRPNKTVRKNKRKEISIEDYAIAFAKQIEEARQEYIADNKDGSYSHIFYFDYD